MMVRPYISTDFEAVDAWFKAHGIHGMDQGLLPEIGLVVDGTAAGFLYRTDSTIAFLDSFVTNPDKSALSRARALQEILEGLTEIAEQWKVRYVLGQPRTSGLIKLGLRMGYKDLGPHHCMIKGFSWAA